MTGGGFRDLAVYQRAAALADETRDLVVVWDSFDKWTLGQQLVRAADSVGANIAEAYGRWSYADRRRILFIARGSLCELEHWYMRAEARGLRTPPTALGRAAEVGRMLNGLAKAWRP